MTEDRTLWVRGGVLALLGVIAVVSLFAERFTLSLPSPAQSSTCDTGTLCVWFFDIGQGDAIFIESPTGTQLLIDGGPGTAVLRELGNAMGFFDKTIDYILATHPDSDHVGGLPAVLERFAVGTIIMTENEGGAPAAERFLERATREPDAEIVMARRGQTFALGGGAVLTILFPDRNPSEMESNASSIVARLTYGNDSFLLTGDSPKSIEEYLVLLEGEHLQSTVLKVGHHGSRTSTSELFLAEVAPKYAVISAEKDNRYGHPHVEVTDALFNAGAVTLNTATDGTVLFESHGNGIEFAP